MATQAFNINNFVQNLAQHKETARADKFDVMIPIPSGILPQGVAASASMQQLNLQCETSELPGRDIQMLEYTNHAFTRRLPHTNNYGTQNFTFIVTGDMWEKQFFDAWMDYMVPALTGLVNYPLVGGQPQYEVDITCNQYDSTGNLSYSVKLLDAIPVSVSALQQSWDNDSIHKLNVVFAYRKWVSNQTVFSSTSQSTSTTGQISSQTQGGTNTQPGSPSQPIDNRVPPPITGNQFQSSAEADANPDYNSVGP
jgi:hypothetical protein